MLEREKEENGIASWALGEAIKIYRKNKINDILLVCEKDNTISSKVIMKNGGSLEREWFDDRFNTTVQRWWIK
ncbi:MAG: hypothetical protein Q4G05_01440 [Clostridia bacterium]|nr:hypothetical protein [Clostridia bacterium]